jgi:hypothetical protein
VFGKVYKKKTSAFNAGFAGLIFILFFCSRAATSSLLHVLSLDASWTATTEW